MERGIINQVELASDLADERVILEMGKQKIWKKDGDDGEKLTAKAQRLFDKWYDHFWNMIEDTKR